MMLPIKDAESIMISKFPKASKKYIFEDYTSFDLYKGDSSVWIEFTIPALNQKITNKYNEYSREEIKEDKLLQKWIKKEIKDYERN